VTPPGAGSAGPGGANQKGLPDGPRTAVLQLRRQLYEHWPGRLYQSDIAGLSVLSISPELTVWCNGRDFVWHENARLIVHPATDPLGAAQRLVRRLRLQQSEPNERQ
jgi:hypothetical protein